MTKTDRRTQIIERKKKDEALKKLREKRRSKSTAEMQEALLLEAKKILGLVIFEN